VLLHCRLKSYYSGGTVPAVPKKFCSLEGTPPGVPKIFRSFRNETGGQCSCIAEFVQNFGRSGTKLEGCSPEQPSSFKISVVHDPPVNNKFSVKLEGCSPEQPSSFKISVVREHDPPN
jgi:hypothetical protein